jgi:hypothetical protein
VRLPRSRSASSGGEPPRTGAVPLSPSHACAADEACAGLARASEAPCFSGAARIEATCSPLSNLTRQTLHRGKYPKARPRACFWFSSLQLNSDRRHSREVREQDVLCSGYDTC